MLSRREFIKKSILANLFLWSTGLFVQGCKKKILNNFKFLSEDEVNLLRIFSLRLIPAGGDIPLSAEDVNLVEKIDSALYIEEKDIQKQFSGALFIFEYAPLLSFKFKKFSSLTESEQITIMKSWSQSRWLIKRTIFNAMKDLCMFMYYTTPGVWVHIGYEGPLIQR